MILLAVLVTWANFALLDEVAVAMGEVVPQGKVKVVQHLEGGIIEEIHVAEGDMVKPGAPLVQLDLATSGVNRNELLARLDGQLLVRARLAAEAEGKDLAFPADVAARRPVIAAAEREAFRARERELVSTLAVLEEQVKQRELEVQELEARQRAVTKNLGLGQQRLRMSTSLLQEGLTAKMEHLQLEAEVDSLKGEMESLVPAIPRARAAVSEAEQRLEEIL